MPCQLNNETTYSAGVHYGLNHEGVSQITVVVKASFYYDKTGKLEQLAETPIHLVDTYFSGPSSSLKFADEAVPFKQGSELILQGSAYPPSQTESFDAGLCLEKSGLSWSKYLKIFGPRRWRRKFFRIKIESLGVAEITALRYENAFGGASSHNPKKFYPFNPVGQGFITQLKEMKAVTLPLLENSIELIHTPLQQVMPACFAALPVDWQPRKKLALKQQFYLDHYNAAPLDQRFEQGFIGGENLHLLNLTAEHDQILSFSLPKINLIAKYYALKKTAILQFICDTLVINTDEQIFSLIWRAAAPYEEEAAVIRVFSE